MRHRPDPRKIAGAECTSCQRTLRLHPKDDPAAALKRKRWSNLNLAAKPPRGICPSCRKNGNHG